MESYLTATELRNIANVIESVEPLWDTLITSDSSILVECDELSITICDTNGLRLGYVRWSEDGPAFYPDTED